VLDTIDLVLVMSVDPGFGGQTFIPGSVDKAKAVRTLVGRRDILIEVDGGVSVDNAGALARAGAAVFVAGAAIFKSGDYLGAIAALRRAAGGATARPGRRVERPGRRVVR
jgi:ribulose-phosphate 3-epimerase